MKEIVTPFQKKVYAVTRKIPRGKVSTYALIARFIGKPGAARAVGNALNRNPFSPRVPCHRVVRSSGEVGGFAFGEKKKIVLLAREGLTISEGRIKDFHRAIVKLR